MKRALYWGLKRAFCRKKFSPQEMKIKHRIYIGLRNAFTISKNALVNARRKIYEGMKRRFNCTPA